MDRFKFDIFNDRCTTYSFPKQTTIENTKKVIYFKIRLIMYVRAIRCRMIRLNMEFYSLYKTVNVFRNHCDFCTSFEQDRF